METTIWGLGFGAGGVYTITLESRFRVAPRRSNEIREVP